MAKARSKPRLFRVPAMDIVDIDGLPYVDAAWLERRLYRDQSRIQRWHQEARRVARRTDPDGLEMRAAYLWHALQATYRVERWRRCLELTLAAIVNLQRNTRVEFGLLVRERRLAAGMNLRDLANRAGVDHKTILNIETASFWPSRRSLERVIAVRELFLTWADVSLVLLEDNPADGRKHRRAKKPRRRLPRRAPVDMDHTRSVGRILCSE